MSLKLPQDPGPGWRRVATDPPSGGLTLNLPVDVTDGYQVWRTTTGRIPPEEGCPMWWRIAAQEGK